MTMPCNRNGSMNESDDERDLTSLTWLMELRNQNFSWPNVMHSTTLDEDTKSSRSIECSTKEEGRQQELFVKAISVKNTDDISTSSSAGHNASNHVGAIRNETVPKHSDKRSIGDAFQDKTTLPIDDDEKNTRQEWNDTNADCTGKKSTNSVQPSQQPKLQTKRATPAERYEIFLDKVKRDFEEYQKSAMNYQTDTMEKPPFNYSHIIGMAMIENGRVTLQQICAWIEKKFAFFRVRKKWNNSIRHNLSLHQCFRKIDRKKFEKGKGGYWELGVDPRKSDRKRIRNRKGTQHRNRHQQQQQQQQQPLQQKAMFGTNKIATIPAPGTTITKQHAATYNSTFDNIQYQESKPSASVFDCLPKLQIENYYGDCSPQKTNDNQPNCTTTTANKAYDECNDHGDEQHLLLDELDIQQNIDVVSCCQQPKHEQDIFIGGIMQCNASDANAATLNNVSNDNSQQTIELLQNHQQQQYQLGTIIISTTTTKTGDISDFAATTGSINCFINGEYVNEQQHEHQKNLLYINDEEIPATCENIIVSSYLDKDEVPDEFSKMSHCQTNAHSSTIMDCHSDLATNTISAFSLANSGTVMPRLTTKNASPIFINNENDKKDLVSYSQRPNVIVEQLAQPSGYGIAPPLATTTATTLMTNAAEVGRSDTSFNVQHNQQILAIDSIRPYIDGIEEAFQYLRSMDNNREDLLDNFLDISVSDY